MAHAYNRGSMALTLRKGSLEILKALLINTIDTYESHQTDEDDDIEEGDEHQAHQADEGHEGHEGHEGTCHEARVIIETLPLLIPGASLFIKCTARYTTSGSGGLMSRSTSFELADGLMCSSAETYETEQNSSDTSSAIMFECQPRGFSEGSLLSWIDVTEALNASTISVRAELPLAVSVRTQASLETACEDELLEWPRKDRDLDSRMLIPEPLRALAAVNRWIADTTTDPEETAYRIECTNKLESLGRTDPIQSSWRDDPRLYLVLIADRLVELLDGNPEAEAWMDEIAWEAEERGWVYSSHHIRQTSHRAFVMDLFTENPIAVERVRIYSHPSNFEELYSFQDVIN